jgi:heterogeneous nuclear ribonucleoprotein R
MYEEGHDFFICLSSGQLLDCSLAKPLADKKDDTSAPKGGPLLPSYTPVGYGLMGAYNPLGNGLAVAGAYNPYGNGLAGAYGVLGAHAAQVDEILYLHCPNA